MIQANAWQNQACIDVQWSGKLINLRKLFFFLELAALCIDDVNKKVDNVNILYARISMIHCGLALGLDGSWNITQLFSHSQEVIVKYLQYFQGQS